MRYACIDLEGVLIPELWPILAEKIGVEALALTTREEPDLHRLMESRLGILRVRGVRLIDVLKILRDEKPLQGAQDFLGAMSQNFRLIFVSDAFAQMVVPLIEQFSIPAELQCHRFAVDHEGFIAQCVYLDRRGKEDVIKKLQKCGHEILAVGDAFNDIKMLETADISYLYRPSPLTALNAPHLTVVENYFEIAEAWLSHEEIARVVTVKNTLSRPLEHT